MTTHNILRKYVFDWVIALFVRKISYNMSFILNNETKRTSLYEEFMNNLYTL